MGTEFGKTFAEQLSLLVNKANIDCAFRDEFINSTKKILQANHINCPDKIKVEYHQDYGVYFAIEQGSVNKPRNNPIYKTNNPSGAENIVLGGVPREAALLERLQVNFPNVTDLRLTPGGLGRYHIVVQIKKRQYGEAKNVIACAFGCHYDIKQVIVVDEDINIDSSEHIEWAVATRFQADQDLVVFNRALGSKLDPSGTEHGLSAKMGLDATIYLNKTDSFYVSQVPGEGQIDLQSVISSERFSHEIDPDCKS